MDHLRISERKWWAGALFSFLMPGLGQLYNGQAKKGFAFLLVHLSWFILFSVPFLLGSGISVWLAAAPCEISWRVIAAIEAGFAAARYENYALKPYNKVSIYLLIYVIAIGVGFGSKYIIKTNLVQAFRIPSASMEPTIIVGDHVLVDKRPAARNPIPGDLIVFKNPKDPAKDFIRRVVAVGGDTVEMREKVLFVNKVPATDNHAVHTGTVISPAMRNELDNYGPAVVPAGSYFVLADNRDVSYDSRFWGCVPKRNVKGTVRIIYWSWDRNNSKVRWARIGNRLDVTDNHRHPW